MIYLSAQTAYNVACRFNRILGRSYSVTPNRELNANNGAHTKSMGAISTNSSLKMKKTQTFSASNL